MFSLIKKIYKKFFSKKINAIHLNVMKQFLFKIKKNEQKNSSYVMIRLQSFL